MYKITFDSLAKGMIKPEKTSVKIVQNKTFTSYSINNKAKTVYEQMRKDGKTGICLSADVWFKYSLENIVKKRF